MTKVPDAALAILCLQKITAYLLSESHESGRHKCQFFKSFGFSPVNPEHLASALRVHPLDNSVAKIVSTDFGLRYIVECSLKSPDGRNPCVVSIWQAGNDGIPGFITAYPR